MPDIVSVIGRRWKLILLLTLITTGVALIGCLLSPKQYVGVATALPANSLLGDKARIFNQNIEALYAEIGTAEELDKLEGTAKLDTIFLATANSFHLAAHYAIDTAAGDALDKAALLLRRNTSISRTGFGELKVKVWDKDNNMAAGLANALLQLINAIHQRLLAENNSMVLQQLQEAFRLKQQTLDSIERNVLQHGSAKGTFPSAIKTPVNDVQKTTSNLSHKASEVATLQEQLSHYTKLMNEYELALKTTPKALLVVENARPSPWADKPKTGQIVLFTFLASLLFSFLLALFVESRSNQT